MCISFRLLLSIKGGVRVEGREGGGCLGFGGEVTDWARWEGEEGGW